jgi:16S rRNA (cytidine1402-2'-O)-methyltransferase
VLGAGRRVTFARELTKTFETIYSCELGLASAWLQADANQQRGEFVLLVEAEPAKDAEEISADAQRVLKLLLAELPLKQAVKLATDITNEKKNGLYELALSLKT